METETGVDAEEGLEMIDERGYSDEEEPITVDHVKEKLGGLLDQIESIKRAKGDMKQILRAQQAQRRVVGLQQDEVEEQNESEGQEKEYFNKLLMRPLLDFHHKED